MNTSPTMNTLTSAVVWQDRFSHLLPAMQQASLPSYDRPQILVVGGIPTSFHR